MSNCENTTNTRYFKIINTYNKIKYLFVGSVSDEHDKIFSNLNNKIQISDNDKSIIKKHYGNNFLDKNKNTIFVKSLIYIDDSINLIRKKIKTYLSIDSVDSIHLFIKKNNISEFEKQSIKKRILEDHYMTTFKDLREIYDNTIFFNSNLTDTSPITEDNISQINISYFYDILGIEYKNDIGKKILDTDLFNKNTKISKGFDDILINNNHRTLEYYTNISDDTIYITILDDLSLSLEDDKIKDISLLYFPFNKESSYEIDSEYDLLIKEHDNIVNNYQNLLNEKIDNTKHINGEYLIKNIILYFNIISNLKPQELFDNLPVSSEQPFMHFKDTTNKHLYKVFKPSFSNKYSNKSNNFSDVNNYLKYLNIDNNLITKTQLEVWKYNKVSIHEKNFIKSLVSLSSKKEKYEETTLIFKTNKLLLPESLEYVSVIINSLGIIFIKLLDDVSLSKDSINKILKFVVVKLNNISKLLNKSKIYKNISLESKQIKILALDSTSLISVPNSLKVKLSKIEETVKKFHPFVYLRYSNNINAFNIKYKKVDFIDNNENYKKFFIKLKQSTNEINYDEFQNLWIQESKNIFNLSKKDALLELNNIVDEINEEDLRKTILDNDVNIELIKDVPDVVKKLDNYLINITNCTCLEQLNRIMCFINTLFYSIYVKKEKTIEEPIKEIAPLPEIKLIEQKQKTLLDEDDLDFDDDFIDSDDEDEDENESVINDTKQVPIVPILPEKAEQVDIDEDSDDDDFEENIENITLRKYMSDMRKKYDAPLYNVKDSKRKYEPYTRSCGTSDMRQPMIINKLEYEAFKHKNLEGFNETSIVQYGSNRKNTHYYICARIWCIKDKVALTAKQFIENDGKCIFCNGGIIDSQNKVIGPNKTIIIKRGGTNNYWSDPKSKDKYKTTQDWIKYLKDTEKDPYVGFLDPKKHPKELCMPCCFSREPRSYDNCLTETVDVSTDLKSKNIELNQQLKIGNKINGYTLKEGSKILVKNQISKDKVNENNIYVITNDGFEPLKLFTDLNVELNNNIKINILNGSNSNFSWILKKNKDNTLYFIQGTKNETYDEKYIVNKDKIALENKHGILPDVVDNLLKNNINTKLKKGRLNLNEAAFVRKGVKQIHTSSFLCCLANYYNLSNIDLVKKLITNITPNIFISLNQGELIRLFSNDEDINLSYFIKWCDKYSDFINFMNAKESVKILKTNTKELNNILIQKLVLIYKSFENFKHYIADFNIEKDYNHFWELFSLKLDWLSEYGLNILIIEKTIVNGIDNIKILCPSNGNTNNLYNKHHPLYILLKTNNVFEPIVYIENTKNKNKQNIKSNKYVELDIDSNNVPENQINIISNLYYFFNNQCEEELDEFVLNKNSDLKYNKLKDIESLIVKLEENNIKIKYYLVNLFLTGIGLILENNTILYTKYYGLNERMSNHKTVTEIDLLNYTDAINNYKLLSNSNIITSIDKCIVKDENIIGLISNNGSFIPIISEKYNKSIHTLPVLNKNYDMYEEEINFNKINNNRIELINVGLIEKHIYNNLRVEISHLFYKKNKNIEKIKQFIESVIINPSYSLNKKRNLIKPIIKEIIKGLVKVSEDVGLNNVNQTCQSLRSKKCIKNQKCGINDIVKINFKVNKNDIILNLKKCKLLINKNDQFNNDSIKKYTNSITEEIIRFPLKKKELVNSKLHIRNKLNKLETELYLNEENYGDEIDRLYNLKTNIYQKYSNSYDSLSISKKETINYKHQNNINKVFSIKPIKRKVKLAESASKQKKEIITEKPIIETNISSNYSKIYATNIGKNGLQIDDPNFKDGYCVPYTVNINSVKTLNHEKCRYLFDGTLKEEEFKPYGSICATSVHDSDSELQGYPKTYGFCESKPKQQKSKGVSKSVIKATSKLPSGEEHEFLINRKPPYGPSQKMRGMKQGIHDCVFPFKHGKSSKELNECVPQGNKEEDPNWCPTEVDSELKTLKMGWCLDDKYKDIQKKYESGELKQKTKLKIKKGTKKIILSSKKNNKQTNKQNNEPNMKIRCTSILPQGRNHDLLVKKGIMKQGEHDCILPFKHGKKMVNTCVRKSIKKDSPNYCPTELKEDLTTEKWGWCLDDRYKELQEMYKSGELIDKPPRKIKIKTKKGGSNQSKRKKRRTKKKNFKLSNKPKQVITTKKTIKKTYNSWIATFMENTDFAIVETKSNGDCFFDSIYKGMNKNKKYSVKNQRELLSDTVNEGDFSFWRTLYDNAYKENDSEILREYDFMEDLISLDQLKEYVKEPSFWANSWAIGVIEKQLNIKTVIFNELMYLRDNLDNVVLCGDMAMEYTVPKCEYCSLTKTDYDKSKQTINEHKTTLGDHHWIESKSNNIKKPDAYILLTYSGNHYRLISYKNKTMFKELPQIIEDKIRTQCSQDGVLKGTFGRLLN